MGNAIVEMMAVQPAHRDDAWLKKSLQAAIELELATLPPYLCAKWSIKGGPGAQDISDLIDTVVQEEMTHLGLVCNLLKGIGGTPKIAEGYRDNVHYPGPLPGGVRPRLTVFLSGLTKPLLHDVFMQIEFPEGGPIPFALTAGGGTFPTIGAFYDAIEAEFKRRTQELDQTKQITSAAVHVAPIKLAKVSDTIDLIKSQGEGTSDNPFDSGGDPAHFYRFAEIYVGARLKPVPGGGFAFNGDPLPFPDTQTVAPIPRGGFPNAATDVAPLITAFNSIFSNLLDKLDQTWQNTDLNALRDAVTLMFQLEPAAKAIMQKPLPHSVEGFYGPDFRYLPPGQRV